MSRSKALYSYILIRLLLAPLMLWTISTLVFLLLRATPGDPVDAILGPKVSTATKEALRVELGLDGSLLEQYLNYLGKLLSFDLGTSMTTRGESVWQIIQNYFPATVELAVFSMAIALIVGITVGSIAASNPDTKLDIGGRLFGIITYAVPPFWAGMILQLIFAVQLKWFPLGTRFPITENPPPTITGLYTIDSIFSGNINHFLHLYII
ncbi:hypothetical protein CYANOKiyG1_14550 [Okeania sp. KiyG1]|nr:hypothetical protein CYANOKiyG1_14550 [Okeania sp. KiyG1]